MTVRICEWRTKNGKLRRIRLYKAWMNMRQRVAGKTVTGSTGVPIWKGLEIEWKTFAEFRAWALKNGYSRKNNSLDRKEWEFGYTAANCRWVTVRQNSQSSYQAIRNKSGYNNGTGPVPF